MSDLAVIAAGWEQAARDDAMFNILTTPGRENGRWDPDAFFAQGKTEIGEMLDRLDRLGLRTGPRRRALDFGCGVGRLTQALASHYRDTAGVDVSPEMVRQARRYARDRRRRCRFHLNTRQDLSMFPNGRFDLIYSVITLQHLPHPLQEGYVREFVRLLSDTGIAVFHLPDGPQFDHPRRWLSMYGTKPETVRGWVQDAAGELLDVELTDFSGDTFDGWRYTVRRLP